MLSTLKSISSPGPSTLHSSPPTLEDHRVTLSDAPADGNASEEHTLRKREINILDGSEGGEAPKTATSSVSLGSGRGGETTEDEMDEDAVLLKRPKAV
jgi:lysophosphatidate acyltransferase